MSNPLNIEARVSEMLTVVGAVLIPGAKSTETLLTNDMVKQMRPGSVIVDVAVDQRWGCC